MLRMMGGLSLAGLLAACGGSTATSSSSASSSTTTRSSSSTIETTAGEEIPDETAGPYPADGSNGPNVLDDEGIVRSDLVSSFGESSGVADGIPIAFNLSLVEAATGSAIPGAVVYLWHCTADGRYSLYEIEDENFLRGVQVADDAGRISFTSIFPGCYAGR
jgi:protocatechuate 3,4-dioxygenase beta subunit